MRKLIAIVTAAVVFTVFATAYFDQASAGSRNIGDWCYKNGQKKRQC